MSEIIRWRLHLNSPPEAVYRLLATAEGRASFWAESAEEVEGHILFEFPNGMRWRGRILDAHPPHRFQIVYFGNSVTTFTLKSDGAGGTDLQLTDEGVPDEDWIVTHAGWISVLMALKGMADYAVDLRNHDLGRSWDQGYVDN